jgi:restriction system protein
MAANWQEYQEEVAAFFRSLGLEAETNVAVQGVRTTHDVDVFVNSRHVGFTVVWIIECKHWKRRVTKLHVLALREIVADLGADRGILLSEGGFQSGAVEAATLTNVHINSLVNLRETASAEIMAMRLRDLYDRIEVCRQRYWDIPKGKGIDGGLRPDAGASGYCGDHVINLASELVAKAFRGIYPVEVDSIVGFAIFGVERQFSTANEIFTFVESSINELETKLVACKMNPAE